MSFRCRQTLLVCLRLCFCLWFTWQNKAKKQCVHSCVSKAFQHWFPLKFNFHKLICKQCGWHYAHLNVQVWIQCTVLSVSVRVQRKRRTIAKASISERRPISLNFYLCSPLFTFPFSNNCSYYYTIFPDPCIYRHINTKFDLFRLIFSHAILRIKWFGFVLFFNDKTNVLYMKFYKQNYANETIPIVFVYKRENKMKKKTNVEWIELVETCVRIDE